MLPATTSISLSDLTNHCVLADTFGKCSTIFFLRLERVDGRANAFRPKVVVEGGSWLFGRF
eukprot:1491690-Pyramimonas_sp.AAC.1